MAPAWNVDGLKGADPSAAQPGTHLSPGTMMSETAPMLQRPSMERSGSATRKQHDFNFSPARHDEEVDPADMFDVEVAPKKAPKWIILPQSYFRRVWVQITLFVAFYIIWVTPVRVGFDMQAQGPWFWIEGIIDIFFYIDLVLNFFTAYETPATSELVTDHKKIAKRYLSSWFWVDLLATFPSDYIIKGIQGTWGCSFRNDCPPAPMTTAVSIIVLLRTMRIFRIIWIFKNFKHLSVSTIIGRLVDTFITVRWMFSILELMVVLMFLGHLCGCFFYMFSHPNWQTPVERQLVSDGLMSTWVLDKAGGYDVVQMPTLVGSVNNSMYYNNNTMAQDPYTGNWYMCDELYFIYTCGQCKGMQLRCKAELGNSFRYITAMYWAYTTMTTVGYGDIFATTIAEKVWAMATMVIGGFFLSFCFGRIASIVGRLDADRAARSEQIETLTQFLKDHELPKALSHKVLDFFKTNVKSVRQYDRSAVLARMPYDLRSQILQHMYDTCIKGIPWMHKICVDDPSFMADFTIRLQPYHSSPDTYVYHQGELNSDLYILVRGDILVMDQDLHTRLAKIPEGSIFGEEGIVRHMQGQTRVKRTENMKCETACDMLRLPIEDTQELCEAYPELAKGLKRVYRVRQNQLLIAADGRGLSSTGPLSAISLARGPPSTSSFSVPAQRASSLPGNAQLPQGGGVPAAAAGTLSFSVSAAGAAALHSVSTLQAPQQAEGGGTQSEVAALKEVCQELQHELSALRQMQIDQWHQLSQLPAALAAQLSGTAGGGGGQPVTSSFDIVSARPPNGLSKRL